MEIARIATSIVEASCLLTESKGCLTHIRGFACVAQDWLPPEKEYCDVPR